MDYRKLRFVLTLFSKLRPPGPLSRICDTSYWSLHHKLFRKDPLQLSVSSVPSTQVVSLKQPRTPL
jgi:hypothetical protein